MSAVWLHISDLHISGGDSYDRDVVLKALVRSVRDFRGKGRRPDLIFVTGDIARSGREDQYTLATTFFDELLDAAGVEKRRLFVVPGNHDADRDVGEGLKRTLDSRESADKFFDPQDAQAAPHAETGRVLPMVQCVFQRGRPLNAGGFHLRPGRAGRS